MPASALYINSQINITMPPLSISPDRDSYAPGETITATISLSLPKPAKARGIFATLACEERSRVQTTRVMTQHELMHERELGIPHTNDIKTEVHETSGMRFPQEKKIRPEGLFGSGIFKVEFQLPPDAPPTSREFGHDNKIHIWKLRAKLDIPLAPDINTEKEIFVSGL